MKFASLAQQIGVFLNIDKSYRTISTKIGTRTPKTSALLIVMRGFEVCFARSLVHRSEAKRSEAKRSEAEQSGAERSGAERNEAERSGTKRREAKRSGANLTQLEVTFYSVLCLTRRCVCRRAGGVSIKKKKRQPQLSLYYVLHVFKRSVVCVFVRLFVCRNKEKF